MWWKQSGQHGQAPGEPCSHFLRGPVSPGRLDGDYPVISTDQVEGNRLGPTIFHHGQGLIVPCRGSGGFIPGRAARGDRRGRWPVERGPGMFVFVVSFAPDTVSRLLLLRLSLPLFCCVSFPFPLPRAPHFCLKLFLATTPVSISTHSKAFLERSQFDRRIKGPYRCCIAGLRTNWKKVCFLFFLSFLFFFCCLRNNLRRVLLRPRGVRDERVRA